MPKIADHIKKLFSKENKKGSVPFFKKVQIFIRMFVREYQRYLMAGALFILLVLVLAKCTGPLKLGFGDSGTENTEVTEKLTADDFEPDKEFQQDTIPELNELIQAYYGAYAADDLDALSTLAYPMSDNEKSYIGVFSQYIEEYQNISCYSKAGLTKGSYLVSVYYELKFYGVDTLAPGLDFFYVETDKEGKLYINNLYSSYNYSRTENELDPNINAVVVKFEEQEDMRELLFEVEAKYSEAITSDVNLATMMSSTIPAAMADWLNSISVTEPYGTEGADEEPSETEKKEDADASDTKDENTTDTKTTDETDNTDNTDNTDTSDANKNEANAVTTSANVTDNKADAQEEQPKEPAKVTVRATADVYIRASANTTSDALDMALTGTTYTKAGTEGDWTKIDYQGRAAYIKSEFLEEVH